MMNHEGCHGQCQGNCNGNCGMQVQPVVCPPQYRFHDEYTEREVPFIHPIVNVNRQHVVDVPKHYYTETTEDVMGMNMFPGPMQGPGFGNNLGPAMDNNWGPGCCNPGRSPWM